MGDRVIHQSPGPSMAQQQFKKEVDINTITDKYIGGVASLVRRGTPRQPVFGNFTGIDFMTMQNALIEAQSQFAALPAKVRARFMNSPAQAVMFCEDPNNREEAIKLGLIPPPKEPAVDPAAPAPKADPEANPVPAKGAKAPATPS